MLGSDWIIEFVVCPKCHSIYEYKECYLRTSSGVLEPKDCRHIPMPGHPQARFQVKCGAPLLKKQRLKFGTKLIPRKIYPYRSAYQHEIVR